MAVTGSTGGPPPATPPGPPPGPPDPPDSPPLDLRGGRVLRLRVSRRMLWVGAAAFPLHNITRVEAYKRQPDRGAAVLRFLKWFAVALVVFAVVDAGSGGRAGAEANNPGMVIVLIVLAVYLLRELFEKPKPVLDVEMSSGSTVAVTLPSVDELRDIAGLIARAIDNPAAEFSTVVQQINSNTNNYGTVVNMNGGRNNRGINL
ncbi:DUF6232 family protein [Streptomyces sp. NPDC088707]|uniref:DUF6232 family protein n=1 Tax=Streptomyces sp. NPDC088707 TaxID=3365871 RepID=UPI00382E0237